MRQLAIFSIRLAAIAGSIRSANINCFGSNFDANAQLLKRCNYNTAVRIRATLRGRMSRKFDAIIMLAICRFQSLSFRVGECPLVIKQVTFKRHGYHARNYASEDFRLELRKLRVTPRSFGVSMGAYEPEFRIHDFFYR
jgi:hypothetical protein